MRTSIFCRSGTGIPRPLMHRHEMDVGLVLDERLSSVAVMDIPIDDENPAESVLFARIVRGDRDVAEQAEPHCSIVDGVVSRRADRRETALVDSAHREIDSRKNAAGPGG